MELDEDRLAAMDGDEREALLDALVAAFPKRTQFERLLDLLSRSLNHYASEQDTLPDAVFAVIRRAQSEGWLARLLIRAAQRNPGNRELATFLDRYRRQPLPQVRTVAAPGPTPPAGADPSVGVGAREPAGPGAPAGRGENITIASDDGPEIRLTADEQRVLVDELASHYPSDLAALPLLHNQLGVPVGDLPAFGDGRAPRLIWWAIHRDLTAGRILAPQRRLLLAALRDLPGNERLADLARRHGLLEG
ncbi:hypothetical protein I6A84_41540 [Frankia sp. CNm7]|uniref:Effector-associated domain-containing protein n=1 Tax=Frankia nepalensis TaxID=1836974 RepID=A0A937RIR2_9ACTN|nr:effector-associated domain EAD1-containing protein [Frankia nepalensis]MBL7497447.1 hypothetical protein [Frankia nepalensis]MBL7514698.1 hypothetical protein [Frankia nepalensis]MBL7524352.1 hypothetical protein [Frankia nepalensis]MBL7629584.1 hypothetical protein [Frankia nepalensis]